MSNPTRFLVLLLTLGLLHACAMLGGSGKTGGTARQLIAPSVNCKELWDFLYARGDGDAEGAAAAVKKALATVDLLTPAEHGWPDASRLLGIVKSMPEAAERGGEVGAAAEVLGLLLSKTDLEAPYELYKLATRHGASVWAAARERSAEVVSMLEAVAQDAERGDWASAYTHAVQPGSTNILGLVLCADILRESGQLEAALLDYSRAAWRNAETEGRKSKTRSLLHMRIEALAYDLAEPQLAADAMKIVNEIPYPQRADYPSLSKEDQRVRKQLGEDADRAQKVVFRIAENILPEPAAPDLVAACEKLAGFPLAEHDGANARFQLTEPALTITIEPDAIAVSSSDAALGLGAVRIPIASRLWLGGLGCFEFVGVGDQGPRCLRLFHDGLLFVGTTGFQSHGVSFRPKLMAAPGPVVAHVGEGRFGRPLEDAMRIEHSYECDIVTKDGKFLDRKRFVLRLLDRTLIVGEGNPKHVIVGQGPHYAHVNPDGRCHVFDPGRDCYEVVYSNGVLQSWRRLGSLLRPCSAATLRDATGKSILWTSPDVVTALLEPVWKKQEQEQAEIEALRTVTRAAREREASEKEEASDARWRAIRAGWENSDRIFSEMDRRAAAEAVDEHCLLCSGSGMYASNDVFGQESVARQGRPGSEPEFVSVTRSQQPRYERCPVCRGSGKR